MAKSWQGRDDQQRPQSGQQRPFTTSTDPDTEAQLVLALVRTGTFDPGKYGISIDHIASRKKEWAFCLDHQETTGHAPKEAYLRSRFTLPECPEVSPEWAAREVMHNHSAEMLKDLALNLATAIRDEDVEHGWNLLAKTQRPITNSVRIPTMAEVLLEEGSLLPTTKTPWPTLTKLTGGIAPGQMWVVGGRLGEGKSFTACRMAVHAALEGHSVLFVSREMTAKECYTRIAGVTLALKEPKRLSQLYHKDTMGEAFSLAQECLSPGSILVADPSTPSGTVQAIESMLASHSLVVVDHIGLMYPDQQTRTTTEWAAIAQISHNLKNLALRRSIAVLAVSQVNRDGDRDSDIPPKTSQLSLSDAIGQDADVVVTLRQRSMVHMVRVAKNRNGPAGIFWARFDPAHYRFEEVDQSTAELLKLTTP